MAGLDVYSEYFNFRERPFALLPDPDFMFWTTDHQRAYTILEYGILSAAPITVVTGEVGAGKTTVMQALLQDQDGDVTFGLISNAQGGRGELLRWVLNAFEISAPNDLDYVDLFQKLQDYLLAEYAAGRRVVIIIDEAQNLSSEALEELRLLTNINSNKDSLLQLILIGQPELRDMIRRPQLRQFAQRVVATFHIPPMSLEGTAEYIRHRLTHAGGTGDEVTPEAMAVIHRGAKGIPRIVNKLCDLCLVYASASGDEAVTEETVGDVLSDGFFVETDEEGAQGMRPLWLESNEAAE